MTTQTVVQPNKLQQAIKQKETDAFPFRPNLNFYKQIGVSKKRFGQILRNEVPINSDELIAIANYFKIDWKQLL